LIIVPIFSEVQKIGVLGYTNFNRSCFDPLIFVEWADILRLLVSESL